MRSKQRDPHFFLLFLVAIALCGCRSETQEKTVCSAWSAVPNAYATGFQIRICGNARELIVFGPTGRTDTVAVYHVDQAGSGNAFKPLSRVATVSTTHMAYINALGLAQKVVGIAGLSQLMDTALVATLKANKTQEIGTADGLDRESILYLEPEALLDQPFGKSERGGVTDGIPSIMITEYVEQHPLGRAEWLRFFGVLFGVEQSADSLFKTIEQRYTTARKQVDATAAPVTVFFGSNWQGTWWVPGGKSYMDRLIADAGGALQFSEPESVENSAVDLETLIHKGDLVSYWGMVVAHTGELTPTVLAGGEQRLLNLRAFTQNGLFAANSTTADIFGKALVQPDVVLLDLVKIFHPSSVKEHNGVYFVGVPPAET